MVRRSTTQVLPIIALFLLLAAAPLLAEEGGNHGWLGVSVGRAEAGPTTDGTTGGIAITGIVADSPAAEAGLRAQDRILTLEGAPISSFEEFRSTLRGMGPGSWVSFTVERDGEEMDFDAKLSGPRTPRAASASASAGSGSTPSICPGSCACTSARRRRRE